MLVASPVFGSAQDLSAVRIFGGAGNAGQFQRGAVHQHAVAIGPVEQDGIAGRHGIDIRARGKYCGCPARLGPPRPVIHSSGLLSATRRPTRSFNSAALFVPSRLKLISRSPIPIRCACASTIPAAPCVPFRVDALCHISAPASALPRGADERDAAVPGNHRLRALVGIVGCIDSGVEEYQRFGCRAPCRCTCQRHHQTNNCPEKPAVLDRNALSCRWDLVGPGP